jgi:hypothetical protein
MTNAYIDTIFYAYQGVFVMPALVIGYIVVSRKLRKHYLALLDKHKKNFTAEELRDVEKAASTR